MPPKTSSTSLSDREMEQLRIYHRCLKTEPELDIEKFASLGGFGNMASARASIGRLLHKLSSDQETSGSAPPAKAAGDEGEGATPVTPASKKKAGGRKRKNDAATTDNAEDESPTKKKASPAKRKSKATTNMADQEEETVVKSEAAESADDHA